MATNYSAIGQYLKGIEETSGMAQEAIAPRRTEPAPTSFSQPIMRAKPVQAKEPELPSVADTEEQRAVKWLRANGQTGVLTAQDIARVVQMMQKQVTKPRRVKPTTPRRVLAPSVAQSIRRALIGQVGDQMRNLLLNR